MPRGTNDTIDNFAQVYPAYLAGVSDLLIALRGVCDGDLDTGLIMAVIGDRHLARRLSKDGPRYDELGTTEVAPGPTVNALSIAQFTDIPRETVRRKVNALIKRGWVVADQNGNLAATRLAATDLADGTQAAVTFIEKLAHVRR